MYMCVILLEQVKLQLTELHCFTQDEQELADVPDCPLTQR